MDVIMKGNKFREMVLKILHRIGFNPLDSGFLCAIKMVWTFASITGVFLLTFLEAALNYQGIETIVAAGGILPYMISMFTRMVISILKKNSFKKLLMKTNGNLSEIYPHNIIKIAEQNMRMVHKVCNAYWYFVAVLMVNMSIITAATRKPFYLTYKQDDMGTLYWWVVLTTELNFIFTIVHFSSGVSGLFLYFVTHLVSEMKMLDTAIKRSIFINRPSGWKILVEYYDELLRFSQDMIDVYSFMLFVEYLQFMSAFCLNLVLWTTDSIPHVQHTTDYALITMYSLFTLAYLSYAGDVLSEQCDILANTVFHEMTEHLSYTKNKSVAMMIIHRSQKGLRLTVGGFFDLNLMTFNQGVAESLRFVTFFNSLQKDPQETK